MLPSHAGSFRLFRAFGIDVFVHWTWLILGVFLVQLRGQTIGVPLSAAIFISVFVIVLIHEFGHALACKQVGGRAEQIVLWPLGGVAFVQPPPRPGPVLWSIAAGPLVNVALVPITFGLMMLPALLPGMPEIIANYLVYLFVINLVLLIFNVLPIYPLDGGQILQSLLWFKLGRGRSMVVAGAIGVGGAALLGGLAMLALQDWWLALIAVFIAMQAWRGIQIGRALIWQEEQQRNVFDPWSQS